MLLPILMIVGLGALALGCGEEVFPPRRRPEHPGDATPPLADAGNATLPPDLPSSFQLLVRGRLRGGREGCATFQVDRISWNRNNEQASFSQQIRWASFSPAWRGNDAGLFTGEVQRRLGDHRLEQMTPEYPEHASLGLRYFLGGTYHLNTQSLRFEIQNVNLNNQMPSGVFLTPLYEAWRDSSGQRVECRAREDFTNEFFIATPSREIEILLEEGQRVSLCHPCSENIEQLEFEVH